MHIYSSWGANCERKWENVIFFLLSFSLTAQRKRANNQFKHPRKRWRAWYTTPNQWLFYSHCSRCDELVDSLSLSSGVKERHKIVVGDFLVSSAWHMTSEHSKSGGLGESILTADVHHVVDEKRNSFPCAFRSRPMTNETNKNSEDKLHVENLN